MMAQQTITIEQLKKDNEERKAKETTHQKDEDTGPILGSRLMLTQGPVPQANGITPQ
ncbi:hypothetical protein F66182_10624, partial [Fusarium sp. NRRL 66182]